ncbi:MAG TPA: SDR family oxidoreductase [Jiangellaceae bacterium]
MTLIVTGTSGRLGSRVANRLEVAGMAQRLLVRDPSRALQLRNAEIVQAEYADPDAARRALDGGKVLFMVSGSEAVDRVDQHRTFIDAAADVGIEHIVYTSFYAAAPDATFTLARDHYATEQHIRASGMNWTFLRDNLYLDMLPLFVGKDGIIRGPAGAGQVSAVALDDIADVATAVLSEPGRHEGRTYDLTGPAAITLSDAAETISRATGKPVTYHPETIDEAYASRAAYGAPDWQVEAWVSTYTAIAAGELAGVTDHVEQLTGYPPTSLEDLLRRSGVQPSA